MDQQEVAPPTSIAEDCIIVGFANGYHEARISRQSDGWWTLEERTMTSALDAKIPTYGEWNQHRNKFTSGVFAFEWLCNNRFDWGKVRSSVTE